MKKRILLVDDSKTSLFMEHMILKRGPYEVVTAGDGAEAVEKATALLPDLIVMDVVMPRMDGFQALRRLREQESTRHVPVILVTTRGEQQNVDNGYDSGCNDYVTKPVDALELLTKVRLQLGA
jgi:CheY-like chemotaxis protein